MCDCNYCVRSKRFDAAFDGMPEPGVTIARELHDILVQAEMDRDYYKAIVHGSWPDADEVIKSSREIQAARRRAREPQVEVVPK